MHFEESHFIIVKNSFEEEIKSYIIKVHFEESYVIFFKIPTFSPNMKSGHDSVITSTVEAIFLSRSS